MKKSLFSLTLLSMVLLAGCSNNSEIERLQKENKELRQQIQKEETTVETKNPSDVKEKPKDVISSIEPSFNVTDMTLENELVKINITGIDFLGNVDKITKDIHNAEALAVVYFSIENKGNETIQPNMLITDYLKLEEDDQLSTDELSPRFNLYDYDLYSEIDKHSRLNIKKGVKIDGAIDYSFTDINKTIKISLVDRKNDNKVISTKEFTTKQIKTSIEKNKSVRPK